MKNERTKLLEAIIWLCERIIDLAKNWNCKGVPTPAIRTIKSIMFSTYNSFFEEVDSMSIDKACERYGITIPTLNTRIEELDLPRAMDKEDVSRKMIPKDTIAALDEYYQKRV